MKLFVLAALGAFLSLTVNAGIFNTNLILNADAESGVGSDSGNDIEVVPDWTTTNSFTVTKWGDDASVPATVPGPPNRGTNFFAGGPNTAFSSAYQIIDVGAAATEINGGTAQAELSGYLGGWSSQDDNTTLTATFWNQSSNTLGQVFIGPVFAAERGDNTAFIFHTATAAVPTGTRYIKVEMDMNREEGSYDDGMADNLSLVLENVLKLQIMPTGNGVIVLWPTNSIGFQLETTTNLSSQLWVTNSDLIGRNGQFFTITNHSGARARFFRLKS